jgi:hypothetical protein
MIAVDRRGDVAPTSTAQITSNPTKPRMITAKASMFNVCPAATAAN